MRKKPRRLKAPEYFDEGNKQFDLVSVLELVADPQFRAGYQDKLAGRPPRRFFFDERVSDDGGWGYERGRLTWADQNRDKSVRRNEPRAA